MFCSSGSALRYSGCCLLCLAGLGPVLLLAAIFIIIIIIILLPPLEVYGSPMNHT
jgi:hypothetical protein